MSGCAQRSIGSDGMALQRGVLMPEWRSMGTWQRVVERSSVVNGLRPGSLEEIIYLSAAQEVIPDKPMHLVFFPFLHVLFSRCIAERSLLAADWKKFVCILPL